MFSWNCLLCAFTLEWNTTQTWQRRFKFESHIHNDYCCFELNNVEFVCLSFQTFQFFFINVSECSCLVEQTTNFLEKQMNLNSHLVLQQTKAVVDSCLLFSFYILLRKDIIFVRLAILFVMDYLVANKILLQRTW